MNYPEIQVGTVLRYNNDEKHTYTVTERIGDGITMAQRSGPWFYNLNELFMRIWKVYHQPLSIKDITLNLVYTDGIHQYRVVYKNSKCILAYRGTDAQMPVLYVQDDISSWKVYVPPVVAKEYKIVWRRGGVNNKNKITAEFLPINLIPEDPQNIIKTEHVTYKE